MEARYLMMKKLLKIVGWMVVLVALVLVAASVALHVFLPPEKAKVLVLKQLSEHLKREVKVGTVSVGLFSGLALSDLKISEAPTFTQGTFITSEQFSIKVALLPLLRKEIVVNQIILKRPVVRIVRAKDGKTFNFSDLMQPTKVALLGCHPEEQCDEGSRPRQGTVPSHEVIGMGRSATARSFAAAQDDSKKTPVPSVKPAPAAPIVRPTGDTAAQWKQFITELWKRPGVASQMERARLKSATDQEWVVAFGDKFAMDSAQRSQTFIQEVLLKVTGSRVSVRYVQEAAAVPEENVVVGVRPRVDAVAEAAPVARETNPEQDVRIQKILTTFKGRVRSTESDEQ